MPELPDSEDEEDFKKMFRPGRSSVSVRPIEFDVSRLPKPDSVAFEDDVDYLASNLEAPMQEDAEEADGEEAEEDMEEKKIPLHWAPRKRSFVPRNMGNSRRLFDDDVQQG